MTKTTDQLTTKTISQPAAETPRYYLADVPEHLRARVLDLCIRRYYQEALDLLRAHSITHYNQADLVNFYHWAPATLVPQNSVEPSPEHPRNYPQPSPELIEDLRTRFAQLPPDLAERVHHALRHDSIEAVASLLWHAGGGCFTSAELYEFRKTLFPPNAMVDAYTSGPPVLRPELMHDGMTAPMANKASDNIPDNLSASPSVPKPDLAPQSSSLNQEEITHTTPLTNPEASAPSVHQLHELRHRLVQLLSARANRPLIPDDRSPITDSPPITEFRPPTSDLALLTGLRDLITRFVVLPEMAAEALALWVLHTYAFSLREVTAYIGVVSPEKRCGKTTLLDLLARLAHRPLTAANISPSALFKIIEKASPTLLIDEADTFLQGRDELAGILNAGYRRDHAYVVRVSETNSRPPSSVLGSSSSNRRPLISDHKLITDHSGLVRYSCWCPKVIAAIGRLPDTLADRSIVITMQRKMPGEKCERMRRLNPAEFRKRCADFVRQHSAAIAAAQPEIPAALNDRAADIWEPLFAIADLTGGDWPALARRAALKLSGVDDGITLIGYFLADIRTAMLNGKVDRVLSRDLIRLFNPMHNRPWEDLRRGREINEYWLAGKLRELDIRPKLLRVDDTVARGYLLADIEAAYRRYVPSVHQSSQEST